MGKLHFCGKYDLCVNEAPKHAKKLWRLLQDYNFYCYKLHLQEVLEL